MRCTMHSAIAVQTNAKTGSISAHLPFESPTKKDIRFLFLQRLCSVHIYSHTA